MVIKLTPLLLIVVMLSGCILTFETPPEIVNVHSSYRVDTTMEFIEFIIPLDYNVEDVTDINLTLYMPDDYSLGSFAGKFPGDQRTCRVSIGKISLYYPGTWTIVWDIDDRLEGYKHFWVEDNEHDRDHYIVETYADSGEVVSFDVYNDGREDGWVEIVVFASNRLTIGGKHVYDYTYLKTASYIRIGHRETYDLIASATNQITIMLNGEEYELGSN